MNRYSYINWKGWTRIIIILIFLLLGLNFILQIEAFFPIIGDARDWLMVWVTIISVIIGAVIGTMLQKQYRDREIDRENQKQLLEKKILDLRGRYEELKTIIAENISILSFSNYKTLLYQVDPMISNIQLIREIHKFDKAIIDAKNRLEIFYQNDSQLIQYSIYKICFDEIVKVYNRVLDAFIKYLQKTEEAVHINTKKATQITPLLSDLDKVFISSIVFKGTDMLSDWKNKFIEVFDQQKDKMDKMSEGLNLTSKILLEYEHEEIVKIENQLSILLKKN
ncbi:MAG: hypothetical protein CVU12_09550 [Bacteroidetes bacterium HGW-Bacteroidetes-7]|jgi:hypothetical protein|nr:MAG: hypothetical protein CVU12_09550 [Bacteroidetes bacterium HGW-Bacteroidetes-7]